MRDRAALAAACAARGIEVAPEHGAGKLQYELFEKTVEATLAEPVFVTQYPAEVSPLARCNDADPFVTDRFELFIGGRELANGFSELNDPEDQAARFRAQVEAKDAGDEEAMFFDADYIRALEYGMPPAAGLGVGIDRLAMLLTNSPSIRDVLLFPQLKPRALSRAAPRTAAAARAAARRRTSRRRRPPTWSTTASSSQPASVARRAHDLADRLRLRCALRCRAPAGAAVRAA